MNRDIGKTFSAISLRCFGQFVNAFSRHGALSLRIDAADHSAVLQSARKDAEAAAFHNSGHVPDLHAEAQIRFVRSVEIHGVTPGHP